MAHRTRNSARLVIIPTEIRRRRLEKFWSPEDLAERAEVSAGLVKAVEGSERSVHLSSVKKLAKALGCEYGDISKVQVEEAAS